MAKYKKVVTLAIYTKVMNGKWRMSTSLKEVEIWVDCFYTQVQPMNLAHQETGILSRLT
jgi:hypothetical protein